jgi:hypothetical protein
VVFGGFRHDGDITDRPHRVGSAHERLGLPLARQNLETPDDRITVHV